MEQQRSAYGGCNTPELTRSSYNSRVPQMGLSASGHRRTLSSNFSGYSPSYMGGTPPPSLTTLEPQSKNPFLNMIQHQPQPQLPPKTVGSSLSNRTYENIPFSPNRHTYADVFDCRDMTGTLRSSLRKKRMLSLATPISLDHPPPDRIGECPREYSFTSSGRVRFSPRSCSPSVEGKSYSSPASS